MNPLASPKELEAWLADAKRRLHQQTLDVNRLWRIHADTSAGLALQGNGTRTRGKKLGFDLAAFSIGDLDYQTVANLATSDITRIYQCGVVLAGLHDNSCGDAMQFAEADWPTVRAWVESGGRLWLNTEWDEGDPDACLTDREAVNDFLDAIGSTLTSDLGYHGCDEPDWLSATPAAANIAAGFNLHMACTTAIGGGTSCWTSPDATIMVAVEQVGAGFVFVCGDGNIWDSDIIDINQEVIRRLMTYRDEDVI